MKCNISLLANVRNVIIKIKYSKDKRRKCSDQTSRQLYTDSCTLHTHSWPAPGWVMKRRYIFAHFWLCCNRIINLCVCNRACLWNDLSIQPHRLPEPSKSVCVCVRRMFWEPHINNVKASFTLCSPIIHLTLQTDRKEPSFYPWLLPRSILFDPCVCVFFFYCKPDGHGPGKWRVPIR